jgi:hypothetical protein
MHDRTAPMKEVTMHDSREGLRKLQEALHELEGVIEADGVTSISVARASSPTPMYIVHVQTNNRTRGPYTVGRDDVLRVLQRAGLEIVMPPESIGVGATVRYDRRH